MCLFFQIILYADCFGSPVLYMCIEYHIQVNMYHVSAQDDDDERMINVHYYVILGRKVSQNYITKVWKPHLKCTGMTTGKQTTTK